MLIALVYIVDLFLWGSTWVAIKIGLQTMGPFTSATIRFVIAFLLLSVIFRLWRFRFPAKLGVRKDLFVTGFVMYGVNFSLLYWGQQHINASTAAILFSSMPFFTALCAHFMLLDEKLSLRVVVGMLIGLAGTLVLFSRDLSFSGSTGGMLAVLCGSFAASWATVKIKRDLNMIRSSSLATLQLPPGLLLMVVGMAIFERPLDLNLDPSAIGSIFYLALFGTGGAFIGWYWLLKRIPVTAASMMTFAEPMVATLLAVVILSESLSGEFVIGACLILVGVLVVVIRPRVAAGGPPATLS